MNFFCQTLMWQCCFSFFFFFFFFFGIYLVYPFPVSLFSIFLCLIVFTHLIFILNLRRIFIIILLWILTHILFIFLAPSFFLLHPLMYWYIYLGFFFYWLLYLHSMYLTLLVVLKYLTTVFKQIIVKLPRTCFHFCLFFLKETKTLEFLLWLSGFHESN